MAMVINTNIASINGRNALSATQKDQETTFNRLSTGLRINSAKDDAAGLYLSESQTKDIRGLNMATRNANDGISLAQTAEGALDQITSNMQRINELATQSANGTYNTAARSGMQQEVNALTQEIARIVETTEFNGKTLLNSSAESLDMQVGFKNNSASRVSVGMSGGLSAALNTANNTAIGAIVAGGLNGTAIIDISTQTAAQSAISMSRTAIDGISSVRADFGAAMNRFDAVISGNETYSSNLNAARSRIRDADFAEETANLAKQQVLQQAGVAALGQANSSSQVVLSLL
ncbi:flagellin [Terasakiispira papahanaumokuakeensis]|uniref:Flagellin n=1 Tax=Terasakiispira papahanaumokuakeensis TaxID=197479 RepID=A0A1E2VAX3_9GAMM|nr:flagellin [Terasakiispira papahanaumokuakeensis]ODC04168.1 flagellin [Terasakiispira papahanaumokuakeensis]